MPRDLLQFFESQVYSDLVTLEHLSESKQCNFSSDEIKALSKRLFSTIDKPEKKVRLAYEYIRNQILYAFEPWQDSVLQTLQKKRGNCFHKSNVMAALLRSQGIPCVFSAFYIHKKSFSWFLEPDFLERLPEESIHVYVEVFLQNAWRRYVDTSLDVRLKQKVFAQGIDPFDCVMLEKPIRRFFTPEEICEWMKKQKPALALNELSQDLIEKMNACFEKVRGV
ncbi:MAG: transglutaminase domain-containing protein [Deltaproteobacteria bacterium]|nr:transglutaminase domain-containing protein [Deltaproteobacteria bacterium]